MSKTSNRFSPEVRTWALQPVLDHKRKHPSRWATIVFIAVKIGCSAPTLHDCVKKAGPGRGSEACVWADTAGRLKALEWGNKELRQANEILRKASAYFAEAELDRRFKP